MIVCMLIATLIAVFFIYLFASAKEGLQNVILSCCIENEQEKLKTNEIEIRYLVERVKKTGNVNDKKTKKEAQKLKKSMEESQKHLKVLQQGKLDVLEIIPLAGYRLIQILKLDTSNSTVKEFYQKCLQFKEKKEAINSTYHILGNLIGFSCMGSFFFFVSLGLCLSMKMGTRSIVIAIIILVFFALMGYLPYDNVNNIVKKRKEEIEWQFPRVVSQLALLTIAGMEVNQAWLLSSADGRGTLYDEMRRVTTEFENNVSPGEAYSKFIIRCNNKYTTKLATAILQNISKGNAEIAKLLRSLNDESWSEHKHSARRMSEKIQSKLMIPTLLMFVGIIILIIVPVLSGFNF